jgi:hypothetical protein
MSSQRGKWAGGVPPKWLRHCRQSPFASSSTSAAIMSSRARTPLGRGVGRSVGLRILAMGVDTQTPTGKLVLNVLGAIGQFEREVMLERQREGIARAVAEGKHKGRAPTTRAKAADIVKLAGEGMKREDIAKRLGVGVASVYRALAEKRASMLAS